MSAPSFVTIILPISVGNLIDPLAQFCVLNWKTDLHAPAKISFRPVRAREIDFQATCVFETINPAVL